MILNSLNFISNQIEYCLILVHSFNSNEFSLPPLLFHSLTKKKTENRKHNTNTDTSSKGTRRRKKKKPKMGGNGSKQEQTNTADDERLKAARIAMEKVNKYISEKGMKGGLAFINLSMQGIVVLPDKLLEHKETLSQLDLSLNRIENLDVLQSLNNIKALNLAQNNLTSVPDQIFSHKGIQSLTLSGNRIPEISDNFQGLESLLNLDMRDNQISVFNPILKLCGSLNILNLSFNAVH